MTDKGIIPLYLSGLSIRRVAKRMGCSATTVLRVLTDHEIPRRHFKVDNAERVVVLFDASVLRRVRKLAGRSKVNEWIRDAVAKKLAE